MYSGYILCVSSLGSALWTQTPVTLGLLWHLLKLWKNSSEAVEAEKADSEDAV